MEWDGRVLKDWIGIFSARKQDGKQKQELSVPQRNLFIALKNVVLIRLRLLSQKGQTQKHKKRQNSRIKIDLFLGRKKEELVTRFEPID